MASAFEGGLKTTFRSDEGPVEFAPPRVVTKGKLGRTKPLALDEFKDLKPVAEASGLVPKQAIPSPTLLHFRSGRAGVDAKAYPDMSEFFADLARVYREEIAALYQAGCRYLQIDETNFPFLCDPKLHDHVRSIGEDPVTHPADLCETVERRHARTPGRPAHLHSHVPRQSREQLGRLGRLRAGG